MNETQNNLQDNPQNNPQNNPMLEAALGYVARGYAIVPGFSPAMLTTPEQARRIRMRRSKRARTLWYFYSRLCKTPLTPGICLHPITTPEMAARWFGLYPAANIHVVLGKHSNLVALDYDIPAAENAADFYDMYHTQKVATGTGIHFYFHYPRNLAWSRYLSQDGMFLKGDHCMMMLPPSTHPLKLPYHWVDETSALAPLPEELIRTSRKAFLNRLGLFETFKYLHNALFIYAVYPSFRLAMRFW